MNNSIFSTIRKWFRSIRTRSEHPISQVELRRALAEMLSDPESKRLLLKSLVGTMIPIEGGLGCPTVSGPGGGSTANRLTKWSDTSCDLVDSAVTSQAATSVLARRRDTMRTKLLL